MRDQKLSNDFPTAALVKYDAACRAIAERRRRTELPPLLEFGGADARCVWSEAVIRAVVDFDQDALECREAAA